jgi:uncharacterized protein YjeT (DUF2065 family)
MDMNARLTFIAAAVVALLFGIGTVLIPTTMTALYGFGTSPSEILLARLFGVELLVVGVTNWLMKDADFASMRPVIVGNMIGDFVGLLVAVMGTLGGVMNAMGWSAVAIYLLLTLGFAYLHFMGQPVSVRQRA